MSHTWVRHTETGNFWQCPDEALEHFMALGWEPSEAPPEPNPAVAERIAWEQSQAAAEADDTQSKPASRGKSKE